MTTFTLAQFNLENWLAQKLGIADLNAGVTTAEERRERIRQTILERGIADNVCGRSKGAGRETYRAVFTRCFATPLETDELDFAGSADGAR